MKKLFSKKKKKAVLLFAVICTLLAGVVAAKKSDMHRSNNLAEDRKIILWAWERPEDLSFVDPKEIGIAFLAATIRVQKEMVRLDPRHQPLIIPPGSKSIAVVRIESDHRSIPNLDLRMRRDVVSAIVYVAKSFNASQVQIDFDARVSERNFYRNLLHDIRKDLPSTVSISITALTSWCMNDTWMNGLPVEEAVPMLFRMGPDGHEILRSLEKEGEFREPLCRRSIGISLDEPVERIPHARQIYIFSPSAWTEEPAKKIFQEVSRWQ